MIGNKITGSRHPVSNYPEIIFTELCFSRGFEWSNGLRSTAPGAWRVIWPVTDPEEFRAWDMKQRPASITNRALDTPRFDTTFSLRYRNKFAFLSSDADSASRSSSGLGHRPFTAATRVRLPYGTPISSAFSRSQLLSSK